MKNILPVNGFLVTRTGFDPLKDKCFVKLKRILFLPLKYPYTFKTKLYSKEFFVNQSR